MGEAIRAAERYVHVEFYILQTDASTEKFFAALEEACARGVVVRVLLDHWANRGKPFYRQTLRRLDAMGAHWRLMLPVQPLKGKYQRPDLRNHRKLLVIDGKVGYMGSQNVTDSTYNLRKNIKRGLHWVDLMVRLHGPVVASINAVFLSDWYSETDEILTDEIDLFKVDSSHGDLDCQIVPSGPASTREQPAPVRGAAVLRPAPHHHRQPVLRARRGAAAGHHDRLPARTRGGACSSRRRAIRRWSTTPSAATTRRCCAPA